jgi:lipopolysaccharide transport system permease protein
MRPARAQRIGGAQVNAEVVDASDERPVVHIRATRGWVSVPVKELWDHREVVYFLAWRDIKARYKQTILGATWAIIQPLTTMIIFSLIFGRLAKMPSDGIPYPIFAFAALLPWSFFAASVAKASSSLAGSGIVSRIYFPRLAMPLSAVLANVVDFVLGFVVLLLMMVYFHVTPTINIIWLPLLLLLAFASAFGVSMVLGAMNVQFRDVQHALPFLIQAWMFATPVAYPASLITDPFWRSIYALNPMVGVVEGFRWALLGADTAPYSMMMVSGLVAVVLVVGGAFYFKRMERTFADVA